MKIEYSLQIFKEVSNRKFHENPSRVNRVVQFRQRDRHDDANSRSSRFC